MTLHGITKKACRIAPILLGIWFLFSDSQVKADLSRDNGL